MKLNRLLVLFAASLGNGESILAQPTGRQAIGLVVSTRETSSPASPLRVDPNPRLRIGARDGPDQTLFSHIVGVVRQSSGRIIIANGASGELRVFDSLGRHLRTVGRLGGGPGEFRQLFALFLGPADSLIAYDVVQGFQVFDPSGVYRRTISYGRGTSTPLHLWPYGWLAGGYQLAGGLPPRGLAPGRSVDSMVFYRVNPKGEEPVELLRYPAFEFATVGGGPRLAVVFSPVIAVAVWPNRFCTGYGSEYEIRCVDLTRKTAMRLRLTIARRSIPPSAVERYKTLVRTEPFQGSSVIPQPVRARREALLRVTTFGESQPAFAQMIASETGELWVRSYDLDVDTPVVDELQERSRAPTQWDVFGINGKWVASVELPGRFRAFQIGRDYVLGVGVDDDDVERVMVLTVRR